MTRITRRKQEAPKRMKYGENGAKVEPSVTPSSEESHDQEDENESEDESVNGKENGETDSDSPMEEINVVDDTSDTEPVEKETETPETREMPEKSESPVVSTTSPSNERRIDAGRKWQQRESLNGFVKMENEIMDLSSRRRAAPSNDSEPEVKIRRREPEVKRDDSQPLDLSQKSSRLIEEPAVHHRRPITPPSSLRQALPISPSLASLQKKFGGQVISSPRMPIDVARSEPKSLPATSQARLWYNNVYRQSVTPYPVFQGKMPYYPLDVPLRPMYPTLASNLAGNLAGNIADNMAGNLNLGFMSDLPSPGNVKPPKPTPPVSMTTMSQTSITQSPNKHASLLPKPSTTNGHPRISPMSSPRGTSTRTGAPSLNFDRKETNSIDFKCDCGNTYSTLYELSVHMQETGHMPRSTKTGPSGDYPKLVRGQDMWLNNGLEQTKQILRCMHCGESFRTLPELTVHMMKTQHYADIFSSAHRKMHKCTTFFEKENDTKSVFKCRVCGNDYESLDSLANHMVESRHHKRSHSRTSDDPLKVKQTILANMGHDDYYSTSDSTPPLVSPTIKPDPETYPKLENRDRSRDITKNDVKVEPRDVTVTDEMPSLTVTHNGDVNHNTDKDSRTIITSPTTSEKGVVATLVNGRETSVTPENEEEHDIKCENCFERIKTDLFVEHVRHCISKCRKITSTPIVTPSERSDSGPPKARSALKAMERFIENFNDRKQQKPQAPMSSLLYDYVGPLVGQKPMNGDIPTAEKLRPYYDRADQSAIHNLYRLTSYGPQSLPPRVPESTLRNQLSRSPLPSTSPKHVSSKPSSPNTDLPGKKNDVISRNNDVITGEMSSDDNRGPISPERSQHRRSPYNDPKTGRGLCSSPGNICHKNGDLDLSVDNVRRRSTTEKILENGCSSPHGSSPKLAGSEAPPNGKTSALASLRGLVDKQMDQSEHPLNSLQKLINQTDGKETSNAASLQTRLINVTSSPYWFSFSHLTRGGWQGPVSKSDSPSSDRAEENSCVVDSDGIEVKVSELKCDTCGKLFSSRGGCRYHRNKCTPSSQNKVSGSKEAQIVQTPFTYMPLEHTNKFSKYYEMARELANKSN